MRLAVTGATGFLGQDIVRTALRQGWDVAATGRDREIGARLTALGATFRASDLQDRDGLAKVFAGAQAIVHSAALSSPWGRPSDFDAVNVGGTRAVADCARALGVSRFVHLSSSSVYFQFRDQLDVHEGAPLPPPVNAYAASKRRSEDIVRLSGLKAIILRPRGIVGPGDRAILPRLIAAAKRGPLPLLRHGEALVDVTPVETVAAAVIAACAPEVIAGTYNISNGEPIRVRALAEAALRAAGVPFRWRRVPLPVALNGARMLERVHAMLPGRPEPMMTAYALGLFAFSQTLNIDAARRNLNWSPTVSLSESIDAAGREWRQRP